MDLELKTERLILRPCRTEDAPRLRELLNVWEVASMLAVIPFPYPEGAAEQWVATHAPRREAGTAYIFAITMNRDLTGVVGIHQQQGDFVLGYWLGVPYWGRGFMSEAVAAIVNFAFTALALPRLMSGHFAENDRSARILQKAGFTTLCRDTKRCVARGQDMAHVSVVLTRDTWHAKSGIK